MNNVIMMKCGLLIVEENLTKEEEEKFAIT